MSRAAGAPELLRDGAAFKIRWRDTKLQRTRVKSLGVLPSGEAHRSFARFLEQYESGAFDGMVGKAMPPVKVLPAINKKAPTVADVVQLYVDGKGKEDVAFKPILRLLGKMKIGDIDLEVCDQYDQERAPASGGTVRRELYMLKAAVNYAYKRRRIPPDQMPVIEAPPPGEPRSRWLSDEELERLLRVAAQHFDYLAGEWGDRPDEPLPRVYRFIAIAYGAGARSEAVQGLTWDRVDLEGGSINFMDPARARTKKRRSVVRMDTGLRKIMERAKEEATNSFVLGHAGSIRRSFENAVARAGLDGVTRHTLRHTRATHLLRRGVAPILVANMLGHSVQTLLTNYAHALPNGVPEEMSL